MSNPQTTPACIYFRKQRHNVIQHAKFTLIKKLIKIGNVSKTTLKLRLKLKEDFGILKLDVLSPKGLHQELSNV